MTIAASIKINITVKRNISDTFNKADAVLVCGELSTEIGQFWLYMFPDATNASYWWSWHNNDGIQVSCSSSVQ